jgi:hypothetical protein
MVRRAFSLALFDVALLFPLPRDFSLEIIHPIRKFREFVGERVGVRGISFPL